MRQELKARLERVGRENVLRPEELVLRWRARIRELRQQGRHPAARELESAADDMALSLYAHNRSLS